MTKELLKILVVDRPLKPKEKSVEISEKYDLKGYNIIIFPFTETSRLTQVIFFKYSMKDDFEKLFSTTVPCEEDDYIYRFHLEEINGETFCDILGKEFEINTFKLTDVEK